MARHRTCLKHALLDALLIPLCYTTKVVAAACAISRLSSGTALVSFTMIMATVAVEARTADPVSLRDRWLAPDRA